MARKRSRKEKVNETPEEESDAEMKEDVKSDNEVSLSESSHESKKRKSGRRKTTSPKKTKKDVKEESDNEETEREEKAAKEETDEEEEKDDDDKDEEYEVEEILDEKMMRGVRHYLIRWKGYDQDGDTWEPESTIDCDELIKKFKEQKANDENESPKKGRKGKNTNGHANTDTPKKKKRDKSEENRESTKKGRNQQKTQAQKKKKISKKDEKVDWESDDEFEVDRILDVYFKKSGKREFLVSWKGYPNSQDSWEPEENLECTDLIERFMDKVKQAKSVDQKELRVRRMPTERFTLNMYSGDSNRRLSRRLGKKQRVQYHDAE